MFDDGYSNIYDDGFTYGIMGWDKLKDPIACGHDDDYLNDLWRQGYAHGLKAWFKPLRRWLAGGRQRHAPSYRN